MKTSSRKILLPIKLLLVLFAFLLVMSKSFAQENDTLAMDTIKKEVKKKKKLSGIIWVPVLASNPANGFMFGVAPALNFKTADTEETSYSSLLGSLVWTTKSQFLFTLKGNVFFKDNKSMLMQDVRYFITSQPTFGLGTGPASSKLATNTGFEYEDGLYSSKIDKPQLMEFNFLRIYETYFKQLSKKGVYAGLGYHLDLHNKIKDNLLNLDTIPPVVTSAYAYANEYDFNPEKYTLSGVSGNLMYDTRDNTVNPYKGMYGLITLKYNPKWLGSSKNSSTLWAEFRDYFNLSKERPRNLIGFWAYGNFQLSGELPYLDLPALGWDQYGRSGRGYPQGRFRGQSIMYSELEWRFPLQKDKERWGGVLFVNANTASNKDANINLFKYINTGYGAGIRFMLNEKSRTNLCLDYAFGNYGSQGFYLSVNEVF